MTDSSRKELKEQKDQKEQKQTRAVIRVPASDATAASVKTLFDQLLKAGNITLEDYAAQAIIWEKINPPIAKAFQPKLDELFSLRTSRVTDRIRILIGEFLTVTDLVSFAKIDKHTHSIFKSALEKGKANEIGRVNPIITDGSALIQAKIKASHIIVNTALRDEVAGIYSKVFNKRKMEYKNGQIAFIEEKKETKADDNPAAQILKSKLIEQTILLHAFGLDVERANKKICSEAEIKAVIDSPDTLFSMDVSRMKIKFALPQESAMHLAQLFNAYYPLLQAQVEVVCGLPDYMIASSYNSEPKKPASILSFDCKIFLEQVLPVICCLATKPKLQGDLSKAPDKSLLIEPITADDFFEFKPVFRPM